MFGDGSQNVSSTEILPSSFVGYCRYRYVDRESLNILHNIPRSPHTTRVSRHSLRRENDNGFFGPLCCPGYQNCLQKVEDLLYENNKKVFKYKKVLEYKS